MHVSRTCKIALADLPLYVEAGWQELPDRRDRGTTVVEWRRGEHVVYPAGHQPGALE